MNLSTLSPKQRITQHKRFVSYGTLLNFYSAKTSFKLETLGVIARGRKDLERNINYYSTLIL